MPTFYLLASITKIHVVLPQVPLFLILVIKLHRNFVAWRSCFFGGHMNLTWRSCIFHPATRDECRIRLSQWLNVTAKTKQSYLTSLSFNYVNLSHRHATWSHFLNHSKTLQTLQNDLVGRSVFACLLPFTHTVFLKKHNLGEIFKSSSHKIKKRAKNKTTKQSKQKQSKTKIEKIE